jgi:hypothetical protein
MIILPAELEEEEEDVEEEREEEEDDEEGISDMKNRK